MNLVKDLLHCLPSQCMLHFLRSYFTIFSSLVSLFIFLLLIRIGVAKPLSCYTPRHAGSPKAGSDQSVEDFWRKSRQMFATLRRLSLCWASVFWTFCSSPTFATLGRDSCCFHRNGSRPVSWSPKASDPYEIRLPPKEGRYLHTKIVACTPEGQKPSQVFAGQKRNARFKLISLRRQNPCSREPDASLMGEAFRYRGQTKTG